MEAGVRTSGEVVEAEAIAAVEGLVRGGGPGRRVELEALVELEGDGGLAGDVATDGSRVDVEHVAHEDVRAAVAVPAAGRDGVEERVERGLVGEPVRAVVDDVDRDVAGEVRRERADVVPQAGLSTSLPGRVLRS